MYNEEQHDAEQIGDEAEKPQGRRTVAAVVGTGLAIGLAWGVAVESQTNEVAGGKIITAEACRAMAPQSEVITSEMINCFNEGVPGGRDMKDQEFTEGSPISFINTYVAGQELEASKIEVGRVFSWSVAPFGVVAAVIYFSS